MSMLESKGWKLLVHQWHVLVILLTPIVWIWVMFLDDSQIPPYAGRCMYVTLIMATYWVTSALPLAITSLLPVALFPLLGIQSTGEVSAAYFNETTIMFFGGLLMAIGVENSGLHKRIALHMILVIGTSSNLILLSVMVVTCFLSMWISNTATTALMLPIVAAVFESLPEAGDKRKRKNILMLAVAYSSNIGGTAVITGSPPNLLILTLPSKSGLNYATWMAFAVPMVALNMMLCWAWLCFVAPRIFGHGRDDYHDSDHFSVVRVQPHDKTEREEGTTHSTDEVSDPEKDAEQKDPVGQIIRKHLNDLGSISFKEALMALLFFLVVFLWFFQSPNFIQGWADVIETTDLGGEKTRIGAATPVILVVLIMFTLPSENPIGGAGKSNMPLLTWDVAQRKIEWGVILLLGGGFALSGGLRASGLSLWLAGKLAHLSVLDIRVTNFIICLLTSITTEVVSNTAAANILVPILKQMSLTLCYNPIYLVLSSLITCSYAFMLPVSTAPNAITFAASTMSVKDMALTGAVVNVFCVGMTVLAINTWGTAIFDLNSFPDWASEVANELEMTLNCTSAITITTT